MLVQFVQISGFSKWNADGRLSAPTPAHHGLLRFRASVFYRRFCHLDFCLPRLPGEFGLLTLPVYAFAMPASKPLRPLMVRTKSSSTTSPWLPLCKPSGYFGAIAPILSAAPPTRACNFVFLSSVERKRDVSVAQGRPPTREVPLLLVCSGMAATAAGIS